MQETAPGYAANVQPLVTKAVKDAWDVLNEYIAAGALDKPGLHHMHATTQRVTLAGIERDAERILAEFSGDAK